MTQVLKKAINYNNLVINLVVPGHFDEEKKEYSWLRNQYDEIENEYLSHKNLKDCTIYIFSVHTDEWSSTGELKLFVKKLENNKFVEVIEFNDLVFNNISNIESIINGLMKKKTYTNKVLVTYGHSSGYFIFGDSEYDEAEAKNHKTTSDILNTIGNITNVLKASLSQILGKKTEVGLGVAAEIDTLPCISPNTLAMAIKKSTIGKFDLMVLANCNMQNIDVISTLSVFTKYIIASQTFVPVSAFEFGSLISNHKKIDFDFCKNVLKNSHEALNENDMAISIVKTNEFDKVVSSTNKIVKYLIANFQNLNDLIKTSRKNIKYVNGSEDVCSVDFFHWLKELYQLKHDWPEKIVTEFDIINTINTNSVYVNQLYNKYNLFGICIYFPRYKKEYNDKQNGPIYGKDTLTNSYFSKKTKWAEFLDLYFK